MKNLRKFTWGILLLACMFLAPAAFAGNEFVLVGGTRAVIEGKQLILIDGKSRRTVAPVGRYDTRNGKYVIIVNANGIVIRETAKERR